MLVLVVKMGSDNQQKKHAGRRDSFEDGEKGLIKTNAPAAVLSIKAKLSFNNIKTSIIPLYTCYGIITIALKVENVGISVICVEK